MKNLSDLIQGRVVDMYDGSSSLAVELARQATKVKLFVRDNHEVSPEPATKIAVYKYNTALAAGSSTADVCLLDHGALKVLAVRYPSDPKYVLARLTLRSAWLLGLIGLFRRVLWGWVMISGAGFFIDAKGRKSYWLIIARQGELAKKERIFIPQGVGVTTFFQWLRQENIRYVVLRFYEHLPELFREGGDLDLLVADEDATKVLEYIRQEMHKSHGSTAASEVPIGLHTVTEPDGIPYYPPHLARQILDNAIDGRVESRVPSPLDALNALIYHVLYHYKGYATGIPSTLPGRPEHPPENDYGGIIKQKAAELGIEVGSTMEDLDQYMESVGWRPKLDLLAKIAKKNAWVHDRFFKGAPPSGTGLAVFILKDKALERELIDDIVAHLRADGLHIIRAKPLTAEQKKQAIDHVRGGNWADSKGNVDGWLPGAIVVALDPQCTHLSGAYIGEFERKQITERKRRLRAEFDERGEASLVHSADTTEEAWDYVRTCLPDESDQIYREIKAIAAPTLISRLKNLLSFAFIAHTWRYRFRDVVVRHFLQ